MDWTSVRDALSLATCKDIGLANVSLGADLALLHPAFSIDSSLHPPISQRKALLIPRTSSIDSDWKRWQDALQRWGKLLSNHGFDVLVASMCPQDYTKARQIADGTGGTLWTWGPNEQNMGDVAKLFCEADVVISARYHGALLGAMFWANIGVLGLEDKHKSLISDFPFIKTIQRDDDDSVVNELMNDVNHDCPDRQRYVDNVKARAEDMLQEFLNRLENVSE